MYETIYKKTVGNSKKKQNHNKYWYELQIIK